MRDHRHKRLKDFFSAYLKVKRLDMLRIERNHQRLVKSLVQEDKSQDREYASALDNPASFFLYSHYQAASFQEQKKLRKKIKELEKVLNTLRTEVKSFFEKMKAQESLQFKGEQEDNAQALKDEEKQLEDVRRSLGLFRRTGAKDETDLLS